MSDTLAIRQLNLWTLSNVGGGKDEAWCPPEKGLPARKRSHTVLIVCRQTGTRGRNKDKSVMGGSMPGQGQLIKPLHPPKKPKLHAGYS